MRLTESGQGVERPVSTLIKILLIGFVMLEPKVDVMQENSDVYPIGLSQHRIKMMVWYILHPPFLVRFLAPNSFSCRMAYTYWISSRPSMVIRLVRWRPESMTL